MDIYGVSDREDTPFKKFKKDHSDEGSDGSSRKGKEISRD